MVIKHLIYYMIKEMYTSNNVQCILETFKEKAAFDTTSTKKRLINSESTLIMFMNM